jgi:putative ABC transport system permease protein
LCSIGGFIGVFLGVSVSWLLSIFTELPAIIEITPIFISFIITVLIGLFFGYYPARKASLTNPVDALLEQ